MSPRSCRRFLVVLAVWPWLAYGLPDDSKQPIRVEADSAVYDEGKGESVYDGNVHVTQGSLRAHGAHMVVTLENGKATRIVMTGSPVRIRQNPRPGEETVSASQRAEYYPERNLLVLIGDAEVLQKHNTYRSDRIEYELDSQVVRAGQKATGGQRVQIILNPKGSQP